MTEFKNEIRIDYWIGKVWYRPVLRDRYAGKIEQPPHPSRLPNIKRQKQDIHMLVASHGPIIRERLSSASSFPPVAS